MDVKKAPGALLNKRFKLALPKIDMKFGTVLALTAAGYLIVNDGNAGNAGRDVASDVKNKVAPAIATVVSDGIDFAGGAIEGATDGNGVDIKLPEFSSGEQQASDTVGSTGSAILDLAGLGCVSGEYSNAKGPWGAMQDAGLSEAIIASVIDTEQVKAIPGNAQSIQINC